MRQEKNLALLSTLILGHLTGCIQIGARAQEKIDDPTKKPTPTEILPNESSQQFTLEEPDAFIATHVAATVANLNEHKLATITQPTKTPTPTAETTKTPTPTTPEQCYDGEQEINHYAPLDGVLDRTVIGNGQKSGIYALSWPEERLAILLLPPIGENHRVNIKIGARSIYGINYCDQNVTPGLIDEAITHYPIDLAESAVDEFGNMPTPVEDVGVYSLNPFTGELTEIKPGRSVPIKEFAQLIDAEEVEGGAIDITVVE